MSRLLDLKSLYFWAIVLAGVILPAVTMPTSVRIVTTVLVAGYIVAAIVHDRRLESPAGTRTS